MKKNRRKRSKNKGIWFFRVIAIISIIIFIVFGIMLYVLDMIPFKFLIIFYIVFGLLYLYLFITSFPKKIKNKFRISSCVFLILFGTIFGVGIKYLNDTMDFVGIISKDLLQKEVYYVMTLDSSTIKNVKDLDNKTIGIYSSKNSEEAIKLLDKKIDSTNKEYINKKIEYLEKKYNVILPKYEYKKGLAIGNLSSQFLAILYLSKLQHYITNNLHIRFINYMDDYILIHNSKEYLKDSLELIENKINNEYKLKLNNKKTIISNSNQGISFLGYTFRVKNNKTIIIIRQENSNFELYKNLIGTKYTEEEFTNRLNSQKAKEKTMFEKKLGELGIKHKLIRPRTPRHNRKVERSHRKDQERFYYERIFVSFEDFKEKLRHWNREYNNFPMKPLGWKGLNEKYESFQAL